MHLTVSNPAKAWVENPAVGRVHLGAGNSVPAHHKKLLRVMKLTTIILLWACLSASAHGFTQTISLSERNVYLQQVFKKIEQQSGYSFVYRNEWMKEAKKLTIEIRQGSLTQVLDLCFKDQPFTYAIVDKIIVVKQKGRNVDMEINLENEPPPIDIRGRIVNDKGEPVIASVQVKGTNKGITTNDNGEFELKGVEDNATLVISGVSIESFEVNVNGRNALALSAKMRTFVGEEVLVEVNTGYQKLPKERATGSFTQVDEKTINRNVGVNVLDRLEGMVSGFLVNRNLTNGANNSRYSIRGRSTIFGNANPLIVLDGFPYEGTVDQINPADIESITLLKDAAAASIWGTRAGNGVIVITSKRAKAGRGANIEFNSSVTIGSKPDLYYPARLSSSEFIDLESFLYSKGFYTSALNKKYERVSPAVEILERRRINQISAADSAAQINQLKGYDVREQLDQYLYRPAVLQQYHLGYSGVTEKNRFYLSVGYDKNLANTRTDDYNRLTLNVNNTYSLAKNKLDFSSGINISSGTDNARSTPYLPYRPYDRLADANGNALPVVTLSTLRQGYVDTAGAGKLLDWSYRPKDEFDPNMHTQRLQYRLSAGLDYKPFTWLNVLANYQYLQETNARRREESLDDFYARDLVNRYTTISGGIVNRGIPLGEILDKSEGITTAQLVRFQAVFNKSFGRNHQLNAIAGYEGGDTRVDIESVRLFGYDPATETNGNNSINPSTTYRYYYEPGFGTQFQTAPSMEDRANISQSYFGNFSYTYKSRYILSGSARKDESNLFGVKQNQKGVPLWSAGLAWIMNKESFYRVPWLPMLKIRATYGYNGNVDKSLSAFLTVRNVGLTNEWASIYSQILNPPNPDLSWEKVQTVNLGVDFALWKNSVSGSIDVYRKHASDLIGNNPIAMQSGVSVFRGNGADMVSKGVEVLLQIRPLQKSVQWTSSIVFNYNKDEVTEYNIKQSSNANIISSNYDNPLVGYPYYAVFSFPSAGLSSTGMPQGYLNKVASTNYASITTLLDPSQLVYHGSASPTLFGNVLNTFGYRGVELSFNIGYKFGYFFRRTNVFNGFLSDYGSASAEYQNRWQKPGDELTTRIPAFVYPQNSAASNFFQLTEDVIAKGDHIRLQDIRLGYYFPTKGKLGKLYKSAQVFVYARNLGILWRANDNNVDPDSGPLSSPAPLSTSIGLNIHF